MRCIIDNRICITDTSLMVALRSVCEHPDATVLVPARMFSILAGAGICPAVVNECDCFVFPRLRRKCVSDAARVLSRLLAVFFIIAMLPVFIFLAALIRLSNKSINPFFIQKRGGVDGSVFKIIKFRTLGSDGKPLKFGLFLRNHAIDELPQLFNIAFGQMAWFGPRPLPVEELASLASTIGSVVAQQRAAVMPGLTGLYQTYPHHRSLSFADMMTLDIYLTRNSTPTMKLWLLWKTIQAVL